MPLFGLLGNMPYGSYKKSSYHFLSLDSYFIFLDKSAIFAKTQLVFRPNLIL